MIELVQAEVIEYLTAFIKRLQAGDAQPFHAVFSDPPYFLGSIVKRFGKKNAKPAKHGKDGAFARQSKGFMGQSWDGFESPQAFQDWCEQWGGLLIQACYPGAVGIFYGGTRTVHRLECGLENAGWEIFDRGLYLYGSGMPHSHNIERDFQIARRGWHGKSISNQAMLSMSLNERLELLHYERDFQGFGSLLKPSYEPLVFARAPRGKYTFAQCAMQFGTGALNIDGCRIRGADINRWPSNVTFDESALCELSDSAKRYYFSDKAQSWEKEAGLDQFPLQDGSIGDRRPSGSMSQRVHKKEGRPDTERRNVHPTVKPLLQSIYWATLLLPPSLEVWRERRLLVPFAGTGSEAIGARFAGWDAITAVEMEADYYAIARARVAYWNGFDSYEQAKPAAQPEADFNDEKPLKKKPKKKRAAKAPALTQLSFLED